MWMAELATRSGLSVPTIKYYLREGLLPAGVATGATRAVYDETHVHRLRLIRALTDVAGIERMFENAMRRFGPVDIVVNNAVVRHFSAVESFKTEDWNRSLAVNVSAAFHCIRLAVPAMRAQGWGRIINMSSIFGARGAENRIDYVTTKTALLGMTRAVAIETARTGITCNAIAPGAVPTPPLLSRIAEMAAGEGISAAQAEHRYVATRHPTERFVEPDNVGALAVFLCSPAAKDITGATLPIDGGWQAR